MSENLDSLGLNPQRTDAFVLDEAVAKMNRSMAELQEAVEDIKGRLGEVEQRSESFDEEHFERGDKFRQELVAHLKDHMLTLQVAEERKTELQRAIDEGSVLQEFISSQKHTRTKTALLTQWKCLEGLRSNLRGRFQALASLPGRVLGPGDSSMDDEVGSMERQVHQKTRVVDILVQRLRDCPELTESEQELIALASTI